MALFPSQHNPLVEATSWAQAVINALPHALVVLDGSGKVCECNPRARDLLGDTTLGLSWREVVAVSFKEITPSGDLLTVNGHSLQLATRPLGTRPGQVLMLTDVTEMRSLQQALARRDRLQALGEMMARLAHQIRTPLAAAMLYAEHLSTVASNAEAGCKLHDRLLHLERIIEQMLQFARGDELSLEPLQMGDLMRDFENLIARDLCLAGAELNIQLQHDSLIRGNLSALLGALSNLMTNAMQARPSGLRLHLKVTQSDAKFVTLYFRDNGPGIAPAHREKIFQAFFTTRSEGTGLGLAIVRSVVEAHAGHLSLADGIGSCFVLRFPLLAASANTVESE